MHACLCRPIAFGFLGPLARYNVQARITILGSVFQLVYPLWQLPSPLRWILLGAGLWCAFFYALICMIDAYGDREAAMTAAAKALAFIPHGTRAMTPIEILWRRLAVRSGPLAQKHKGLRLRVYQGCKHRCIRDGHFCRGRW